MDQGNHTDAVFLDFPKAFDSVPHHRLLANRASLNFDPSVLYWISDFLASRLEFTSCNNSTSSSSNVFSSVPEKDFITSFYFLFI